MRLCIFAVLLATSLHSLAQKGMTTVGIQIKPLLPLTVSGSNKVIGDTAGVHFERELVSGFNFGLTVRHNFTKLIAFEAGINYIKRKYELRISEREFGDISSFRIIGYEIPLLFMMYSRVAENLYINGALGPTLDMFASHVENRDTNFIHVAYRNQVFMPAVAANLGAELRTEKSGNIYLGFSFQRPFEYIYLSRVSFKRNRSLDPLLNDARLSGSYLSIDLRYYFPDNKRRPGVEVD
jgi:hypothetical protein